MVYETTEEEIRDADADEEFLRITAMPIIRELYRRRISIVADIDVVYKLEFERI